ncbi:MAG: hypothetical protein J6X92_05605 [Bacteroidales bacterium]|nr:hypothetical protein [Bacteroidales bacterium]
MSINIISDNIISPLGFSSETNFKNILEGQSGIKRTDKFGGDDYVSIIDDQILDKEAGLFFNASEYTRFEKMSILSIHKALSGCSINISSPETAIVISTAKGNIDLIEEEKANLYEPNRIALWKSAEIISNHFGNPNKAIVISNACISGTLALVYANRLLSVGKYKDVVIVGCDIATQFIVSGFNCLKATDNKPCKPFDIDRKGLNLGEGAATIILSSQARTKNEIKIATGSSSNDANHISGPSRTGEGLYLSITDTLEQAKNIQVDMINPHGTGTLFNDEMESIAFSRCLEEDIPVCGLKGYFGHTLGASGVIETVICKLSLQNNMLVKTLGYSQHGVSKPLNITQENINQQLNTCLKTSSGFGGTNASILLTK